MEYFAIVEPGDRKGVQVSTIPACPGCIAQSDGDKTIEQETAETLELWLEGSLKLGHVPPAPGKKPRAPKGCRVLSVSVPPQLAARLQLRLARHAKGLTQAELAQRAGVSQNQIAKLENPDANPSIATLAKVAAAMGMRLELAIVEA